MGVTRIELALSPIFGHRKIDLRTKAELSPYIRDKVLRDARLLIDLGEHPAMASSASTSNVVDGKLSADGADVH